MRRQPSQSLRGSLVLAGTLAVAAVLSGTLDAAGPARLAPVTVDYPLDGSVFPPEITPPTFIWRDASPEAGAWEVEIAFSDGSEPVRVEAPGEPLKIGEIDPEVVSATNEPPRLTPEQAAARTWTPDDALWERIKRQSQEHPATVRITGFPAEAPGQPVSRGQVTMTTSADPVGAPIFYRDVPLMPNSSDDGVVTPLPSHAMGLVKWRLRDVGEGESRIMMEGLPSCANCHSFSLDGRTMGLDVDGPQNHKGLYALTSVDEKTSIRNQDVIEWSSFKGPLGGKVRAAFMSQVSPTGKYVVTTILDPMDEERPRGFDPVDDKFYGTNFTDYRFLQVFFPTRGTLAWYSRETGILQPLPGAADNRYVQTDGVWSPDEKWIVFARARETVPYPEGVPPALYANDPNETQIQYDLYRVPFNEGRGGKPERIEGASENGMSNSFPKVSPDGKWIVFVQARNGQLMRPDSQLYIVPFDGGEARRMTCNTSLMNSWHSFSPNGRWMVFSSKARSPYTQMYLTHIDEDGNDSPAILIDNATAANRAVNIPEFLNIPPGGLLAMDAPATDFFAVVNRATELTKSQDYDAAVAEWEKAVDLDPRDAKARVNLALALHEKGDLETATVHYREATEMEPDNPATWRALAVALIEGGRVDEAIATFEESLEIDPGNPLARSNLCSALIEKGRVDEGVAHCRAALETDPGYADAHNTLGIALSRAGQLGEATEHLTRAVQAAPETFEYQFNLGRVLAAREQFAEALPHFETAVKLSSGAEPFSLNMLAAVYAEVGRFPQAAQTARQAAEVATREGNEEVAREARGRLAEYEARARSEDPGR